MAQRGAGGNRKRGNNRSFLTGIAIGALLAVALREIARDPNRPIRALYDLVAPVYDLWAGEKGPLRRLRQQLVEMLDLKPGDHVLEVNVGTGANLPFIAAKIGPTGRIYGLDISEGMLAQARKKVGALPCPVELRQGVAEELPYADNSFDAVLHLGGINFFTDRAQALAEMSRVAKPGAKIVVSDETIAPFDGLRALLARALLALAPRLRPPTDLLPDPRPDLHYLGQGYVYAIVWRKPG